MYYETVGKYLNVTALKSMIWLTVGGRCLTTVVGSLYKLVVMISRKLIQA